MLLRSIAHVLSCLLVSGALPVFAAEGEAALRPPEFKTPEAYLLWMRDHAKNINTVSIKLKPGKEPRPRAPISQQLLDELSELAGVKLSVRTLGIEDWQNLVMDRYMTQREAQEVAEKLMAHPDLEAADGGRLVIPMSGPGAARMEKVDKALGGA